MWCNNLPHNRGRLSQVTSPYKLFINNHTVTFEWNPILFNCNQEFIRNFGLSCTAFLKTEREKYKSLQTKSVTTSPGLSYPKNARDSQVWIQNKIQLLNYISKQCLSFVILIYFISLISKKITWLMYLREERSGEPLATLLSQDRRRHYVYIVDTAYTARGISHYLVYVTRSDVFPHGTLGAIQKIT